MFRFGRQAEGTSSDPLWRDSTHRLFKKEILLQIFRSDGLPAETHVGQISNVYFSWVLFMSLHLFASLSVVVVLYLLMATSPVYLSRLFICNKVLTTLSSNEVMQRVRIQTLFLTTPGSNSVWTLMCIVIQFRCGKRQDTISDKRGIHNTRLTRHNRCG